MSGRNLAVQVDHARERGRAQRVERHAGDGRHVRRKREEPARGTAFQRAGRFDHPPPEPGSGKTELVRHAAAAAGAPIVMAAKRLRTTRPEEPARDGRPIFIDALDEASARRDGDAVQWVLEKLNAVRHPIFVLSCRALERLEAKGLGDLAGDPLTSRLVAAVAEGRGELPDSRAEPFAAAMRLLWTEHDPDRRGSDLDRLDEERALDAAGALSAAMLMGGFDALTLAGVGRRPPGAARSRWSCSTRPGDGIAVVIAPLPR